MKTPVSIVIPAFNQVEYCRECLQSILASTSYPYQLVLVDNGSTDGVGEFFDKVAGATVVHTGANLGFPAGVNRGLAHAEGHIVLLNSDTIVPRDWLTRLVSVLDRHERIGLVGPMTNYVSGPQLVDGLEFGSPGAIDSYADERWNAWRGQMADVERLVGFCMLIRDSAFRAVGMLDESFGIGNFEDDDYCLRVRRAGYRTCMALDCFVFHYGSRTFRAMGLEADRYNDLIAKNEARFREKWGLDSETISHAEQIAGRLTRQARETAGKGDVAGALRLYKEAIATCPVFDLAYNDLGVLLWNLGERERALEQFQRAVRLNPGYEEAQANLRDAAHAMGRLL